MSKVRVHLSRQWTDTQEREKFGVVRSQLQINNLSKLVNESTSAPVTDRHTSTKMQVQ